MGCWSRAAPSQLLGWQKHMEVLQRKWLFWGVSPQAQLSKAASGNPTASRYLTCYSHLALRHALKPFAEVAQLCQFCRKLLIIILQGPILMFSRAHCSKNGILLLHREQEARNPGKRCFIDCTEHGNWGIAGSAYCRGPADHSPGNIPALQDHSDFTYFIATTGVVHPFTPFPRTFCACKLHSCKGLDGTFHSISLSATLGFT